MSNRIAGPGGWRGFGCGLAFAGLVATSSLGRGDDAVATTNAPDAIPAVVPEPSGLSLRPAPAAPSETPEVAPSGSGMIHEPFHFPNVVNPPDELPAHLLVVYNEKDPDSKGLADYYAAARNIPAERVLGIACPTDEEITRAQFEETMRRPIFSYISQKGWITRQNAQMPLGNRMLHLLAATHNEIWAMVLMRGIPLKIAPDPSEDDSMEREPALQSNAAAVDSELALLPVFGLPKGGFVPNPFYDSRGTGVNRVGPDLAKSMILVTRLDGPTPENVRRMIKDCLEAERDRLAGLAVIDSRGITDVKVAHFLGDSWMRSARDFLTQDGWSVKFDDKGELLPATDVSNHVAFYMGWYNSEAVGPWVTAPDRFVPGAFAYHLHSFSGTTVRNPASNWVGPLIAHGADASMGTVYEPYLPLTPHLDIFTKRFLDGNYFAEAAYASQVGLSWMTTVVGDPLYRPFHKQLELALLDAGVPHTGHDDWLLVQQTQRRILAGQVETTAAGLERSLDVPAAGPVASEVLGDLLENLHDPGADEAIKNAYEKAFAADTISVDRIRVGLKLAQYYNNRGQGALAAAELDTLRKLYPIDAPRFGIPEPLVPTGTQTPGEHKADASVPDSSPAPAPAASKP